MSSIPPSPSANPDGPAAGSSDRGFDPASHPFMAELVDRGPSPARPSRRWLGLIVCGIVALGGLAMWVVPHEVRQWRLAVAEEQRLNGDLAGALEKLDAEIRSYPEDIELKRRKAHWLLEKKDLDGALREVNLLLDRKPGDIDALMLRSEVHQHLGQPAEAVQDWKRILELPAIHASKEFRAVALNGLAYARALANVELDEGLVDIEEALAIRGENYAFLDTRGFLNFRRGDLDRALSDLMHSVEYAEAEYEAATQGYSAFADPRLHQEAKKRSAQSLAVIHYHRALIFQARNEAELAEVDRQRVRELGFEPTDKLF